ncbi:MAG: mannosyltransferase [Burkholderiales bacterium PBB5]|nr:MAG: mannosyltransferase [Burkholderiales bacterium PBB5]
MPALQISGASCTFVSRERPDQRYTAVAEVSLTVGAGEFVSVVGPTGCGKSTLLNLAAGLLAPSTGSVQVFGTPPDQAAALADDWLQRVGLGAFGDRYPHQMSGGMRKRASLAQTLVLDPDLILMDEPFSALDIQTRQLMENEVLALWQGDGGERRAAPSSTLTPSGGDRAAGGGGNGRKAVLFITHDLDEAIAMSDRVVVMSAGPASRPIGEFVIDLERPRDVAEVRTTPRFIALHNAIWAVLRDEVLKGYQQQLQPKPAP